MMLKNNVKIKHLDFNELYRLRNQINNSRDTLIIQILYESGCTVNELVNLKIGDIDEKNNKIRISRKNSIKEPRESFISGNTMLKIASFLYSADRMNNKEEYLFKTRQSHIMTTKRISQIVRSHTMNAGIEDKNTPQILRYTHIVHAYLNNVPIDAIQNQIGMKKSRAIQIFNELSIEPSEHHYRNFLK